MLNYKPKKGNLLIANPTLIGNILFNRSIILLVEQSAQGSTGLMLNKPLDHYLHEFISDITVPFRVFHGGPVQENYLCCIHRVPHLIENSVEIGNGLFLGGDLKNITTLINTTVIQEDDIRFFLGHSGWASQQLDRELSSNSWLVMQNEYKNHILEQPYATFWKEKIEKMGGSYILWSNAPQNPSLN